ncbi:YgfZ/GcvT domain-containing protein [Gemmatimonas sp.]|uniref:CAF17-like 4Fe-4S cluster assembly/insertion protein YgfZ n=1 Tax=Gemmatimonas sp. TaxID=1962908 RepID=UPI0037BEECB5
MRYPLPLSPDDVESYRDLRREAVWIESMSHWSSIHGPKAVDALNGLVTNDVSQLAVGMGQHAVALTPKGKVVCDMYIARTDDDRFLLTMQRRCAPAWMELARKYINPRLATVTDESTRWATWMIYGINAVQAVANLGGAASTVENLGDVMVCGLADWPVWSHGLWNIGTGCVRLARVPTAGTIPGFMLLTEATNADLVRARLEASAMRRASRDVLTLARVEGGRPAFGIDMDENTIPQEANLDTLGAISFTKGCYTGQETVARVHFRGHVNRHLRGLVAGEPIPRHAHVLDGNGKDVGEVRSTVISPRLGPIALAMLRREVQPGDPLRVQAGEREIEARMVVLPFPE